MEKLLGGLCKWWGRSKGVARACLGVVQNYWGVYRPPRPPYGGTPDYIITNLVSGVAFIAQ